jgi:hypothetical protein
LSFIYGFLTYCFAKINQLFVCGIRGSNLSIGARGSFIINILFFLNFMLIYELIPVCGSVYLVVAFVYVKIASFVG